ncbi:hypothetical protein DW655_14205 [Lachnospiraceae bacterium AM23-2LB]|nr:hypothetical protein DW655_14205 [Lachnospiraceae bacterium AM23-2LB]RJV99749.1 hypothetical protein DW887_15190 [Lachnospiraceae bacterium AM40-2BH]
MNDAYRDVRGVKVTTKRLRFALHRPFSPLYTDATHQKRQRAFRPFGRFPLSQMSVSSSL